jgi:hypothetical protein
MNAASGPSPPAAPADIVAILVASLEQLAAAGEVEAACRLAGQACAVLRRRDAQAWHRFNGLLHRLTRWPDPAPRPRGGQIRGTS